MSKKSILVAPGYRPHPKQYTFHQSKKRFVVCAAGVRGGKTLSATVEMLRRVYEDLAAGKGKQPAGRGRQRQPRLLYWVVAPTSAMCIHVHRYIATLVDPMLIERDYESSIWLKPDILIEFKTAERPERLVGASVNGMLIDEACRVKGETWKGSLRGRLADTAGWAIFVSSPLGGHNNWLYQELVSRADQDPDIGSFHWTTAENLGVPGLKAEAAIAERTMPAAFFRREFLADWASFGGQVYEEFDEKIHVTSEERLRFEYGLSRDRPLSSLFTRVVGSLDPGFASAGCLLTVGEIGDGNWVVIDESYGPGRRPLTGSTVTWLGECQRSQREYGTRDFVGDSAEPETLFDLRNNGVPIRGARKEVFMGIRRVASALHPRGGNGRPGLRILDRCKNLIREFKSYQWTPVDNGGSGFLDEPASGQSDHALDALRYAAMELRLYDYAGANHSGYGGGSSPPPVGLLR